MVFLLFIIKFNEYYSRISRGIHRLDRYSSDSAAGLAFHVRINEFCDIDVTLMCRMYVLIHTYADLRGNVCNDSTPLITRRWISDNALQLDKAGRGSILLRDIRGWTSQHFIKASTRELKDIFYQVLARPCSSSTTLFLSCG